MILQAYSKNGNSDIPKSSVESIENCSTTISLAAERYGVQFKPLVINLERVKVDLSSVTMKQIPSENISPTKENDLPLQQINYNSMKTPKDQRKYLVNETCSSVDSSEKSPFFKTHDLVDKDSLKTPKQSSKKNISNSIKSILTSPEQNSSIETPGSITNCSDSSFNLSNSSLKSPIGLFALKSDSEKNNESEKKKKSYKRVKDSKKTVQQKLTDFFKLK